MNVKWKKMLVILLAAVVLVINHKAFAEEAESRRFSILSISGSEAFLTRGAAKEMKASAGMPVGQGSSIRTGSKTKMYLETDDSKTIRLDTKSEAEVSKSSAKLLKITLKSGSLFFNVDKPLQDDEEMTFDAAQTSMSIRGTSGIISINDIELVVYLIEGTIAWDLGDQTMTTFAGQKVTLRAVPGQAAYQLQSIENFTWEDLPFFALECVFEQKDKLDLSAINLTDQNQLEQAQARLIKEQAIEAASSGNPRIIRMDVPETRTKRNRGRGSTKNTSTATPSQPTTAAPTEEESTSTQAPTEPTTEPTTEETPTETDEPTTEELPSEEKPDEPTTSGNTSSGEPEQPEPPSEEDSSSNSSSSSSPSTETTETEYQSPIALYQDHQAALIPTP